MGQNMDAKERSGVLLFFLSDFKDSSELPNNYSINGTVYTGRQTNEAPTDFLLDMSYKEGYPIKKVLCITSQIVKYNLNKDGKTSYEVFSERFRENISSKGYDNDVNIEAIDYEKEDEGKKNDGFSDIALPVYKELNKKLQSDDDIRVYIDYTGGFRDISFLMTTVVRFLEIKGIKTGRIVYSSYQEHRIIDITYIYNIMRLINGVDEFATTGNPRELKRFSDEENLGSAKKLMGDISELADRISLCQVEDIDRSFLSIKSDLEDLKKSNIGDESNREATLYLSMLQEMIPSIQKKMYLNENVCIPNIIKWCIENSLIQQALTLYVERMPSYYFDNDIIHRPENGLSDGKSDAELFYGDLYDGLLADPLKKDYYSLLNYIGTHLEGGEINEIFWKITEAKYSNLKDQLIRIKNVYSKRYQGNKDFKIYGEDITQRTFNRFIKEAGKDQRYIAYLYDNKETYVKEDKKNQKTIKTYIKKWNATCNLLYSDKVVENYCSDLSNETVARILRYYLAVKMIRNSMNHANDLSEGENQDDVSYEETRHKLKSESCIDINPQNSADTGSYKERISSILQEGIEITNTRKA